MKGNGTLVTKLIIISVIGIIIVLGVLAFIFTRKGERTTGFSNESQSKARHIITCPLAETQCALAVIENKTVGNHPFSELGYYNVATSTPILATFDGTLVYSKDTIIPDLYFVAINNNDYGLRAEYRFIGDFKLQNSASIKRGQTIGTMDQKIRYFDNKYSLVFSIFKLYEQKMSRFDRMEKDNSQLYTLQ